ATQLSIYETILKKAVVEPSGYDVIISGYYGFKNIGDDAMLMAIINNLRTYNKDLKIAVLSNNPAETKSMYSVDSIKRFNFLHILKVMKSAKLFIYGGGNIIQDNTSTRSLLYYLSTTWLAKKMDLKIMFYANGIGPLKRNNNKSLTRKILNKVNVITLRENLSMKELESLNINEPSIIVTADPALTVKAASDKEADKILLKEGLKTSGPYVGFSVRNWYGSEKFTKVIAQTADYMVDNYGITPIFIPMHYPDDIYVIEEVVSHMKTKGYIIRSKYSVPQTLAVTGKMDMLIGMRLHALIFAASSGVPIIGLAYEPKIDGFLQYANQPSAGNVTHLEFDKLKRIVDEVWLNRVEISKQLEKDVEVLKRKALENAKIAVGLIEED
ncbi:MAG: polysaccharide pyruvyl transferase CsaB, partial [Clostridiaceae bacterium]|nr:polysaccharide pyruvyl transferase CsaB [Clostridiaceae bacterium]